MVLGARVVPSPAQQHSSKATQAGNVHHEFAVRLPSLCFCCYPLPLLLTNNRVRCCRYCRYPPYCRAVKELVGSVLDKRTEKLYYRDITDYEVPVPPSEAADAAAAPKDVMEPAARGTSQEPAAVAAVAGGKEEQPVGSPAKGQLGGGAAGMDVEQVGNAAGVENGGGSGDGMQVEEGGAAAVDGSAAAGAAQCAEAGEAEGDASGAVVASGAGAEGEGAGQEVEEVQMGEAGDGDGTA